MNDDETMVEYLKRSAKGFEAKLIIKKDVNENGNSYYTLIDHLMSKPSEETFSIQFGDLIFTGCSCVISKCGKRMEWFNDEHNGVIELK